MEQIRSPTLTMKNLQEHTSKWSAVNVIKQLWKKNKLPEPETNDFTNPGTTLDDVPIDTTASYETNYQGKENIPVGENEEILLMPITTSPSTTSKFIIADICSVHHTETESTPQNHVDPVGKTLIPFSSSTIEDALVKTVNRKPLQNYAMNKVTPTPQVITSPYSSGDPKLCSTNTISNTEAFEQKILFPENVQDTPVRAGNVPSSATNPFADTSNMGQYFISASTISTEKVEKDNLDTPLFPRLDTTNTHMDGSVDRLTNPCDDHPNLFLPVINEVNGDLIDGTTRLSLQDILFFELQNADWAPEMSANEVVTWFEEQSVLNMQYLDSNRIMYLQRASFDSLPAAPVVFDLDDDDDANTAGCTWIHIWVVPMLTLITTTSVVFYLFGDDFMYFFFDPMNAEPVMNVISNDPSQHLLARMFFVWTEFGYFGEVSLS
jgi:hypothetical protein